MKYLIMIFILTGCTRTIVVVCPDKNNTGLEKCVFDAVGKEVKITDIRETNKKYTYEVDYRNKKKK